jgi:ABC-type phosphate transport system substrate-binding protein
MARLFFISLLSLVLAPALRVPASARSAAGIHVIVNSANPVARVEKRFVAEAFLKKRTRWANDHTIQPVDLGQKSSARSAFSREMLGRDVVSVRRYWAQLVFSGRGVPPPELATESDVVTYVAAHDGAIGYVATGIALDGVKVVEVE